MAPGYRHRTAYTPRPNRTSRQSLYLAAFLRHATSSQAKPGQARTCREGRCLFEPSACCSTLFLPTGLDRGRNKTNWGKKRNTPLSRSADFISPRLLNNRCTSLEAMVVSSKVLANLLQGQSYSRACRRYQPMDASLCRRSFRRECECVCVRVCSCVYLAAFVINNRSLGQRSWYLGACLPPLPLTDEILAWSYAGLRGATRSEANVLYVLTTFVSCYELQALSERAKLP